MDSSYLNEYAHSADSNALFNGAPLTGQQKELIAKVDEYGVKWAERAFKHDLEASFPTENYNDLKNMGFLALCVPKRLGTGCRLPNICFGGDAHFILLRQHGQHVQHA